MYLVFPNLEYDDRSDLHSLWRNDANCSADWTASAKPCSGLLQVQDRAERCGIEGSSPDLGHLQHSRTKVSVELLGTPMYLILSFRVATAYGQPANTLYDWTLASKPDGDESFRLPSAILNPLLIEQFNDKVFKTLYTNHHDPVGLGADHERNTYVSFLSKDFEDLQEKLHGDTSPTTNVYLHAACLHLRISAFFSPSSEPSYQSDLFKLYSAITSFLNACLELNMPTTVSVNAVMTPNSNAGSQNITMASATIYLFQTMLAAGFGLLKLNYSFLGQHGLDTESAKVLFRKTIFALRGMSVAENDLAERLAEVLAQVWLSGRVRAEPNEDNIGIGEFDDSLRLRVRCRMSMSLVYDAVWRWRQNFQLKGKSLESKSAFCTWGETG